MPTIGQSFIKLRKLKAANVELGKRKATADQAFKKHQAWLLTRAEAEGVESMKIGGTLFSVVEKVKGQIEDRGPYVRWAMENDEGLQEFIGEHAPDEKFVEALYQVLTSLTLLTLKENTTLLNQQASEHVTNHEPLPPGLGFRPDPYISQKNA